MLSNKIRISTYVMLTGIALLFVYPPLKSYGQEQKLDKKTLTAIANKYPGIARIYMDTFATFLFTIDYERTVFYTEHQALQDMATEAVLTACKLGLLPDKPKVCPTCEGPNNICGAAISAENVIACAECRVKRHQCLNEPKIFCSSTDLGNSFNLRPSVWRATAEEIKHWTIVAAKYPEFARAFANTLHSLILFSGFRSNSSELRDLLDGVLFNACRLGAIPSRQELYDECEDCNADEYDLGEPVELQAYLQCQGRRAVCILNADKQVACPDNEM